MEETAIELVLRSLQPTPWGWRVGTPGFAFLGQQVSLQIDTRDVPTEDPPPTPNPAEVSLARLVLGDLPSVLTQAEHQYRTYHRATPEAIERADDPNVWVSRSVMARDGADRWQFVVGIAGAEDFGTHAEFTGLTCVGVWSSD